MPLSPLLFSLSISPCSLWNPSSPTFCPFLPATTAPPPPPSVLPVKGPAGGPQRGSPSLSLLLPLSSFASHPSLLLAPGVHGLRAGDAGALCSHFHMWHERLEVCISASYMLPSPKCILNPPKTQHISYLTSIRCLKIQTPLNLLSKPSCIIC